jgi:hypothetical protein
VARRLALSCSAGQGGHHGRARQERRAAGLSSFGEFYPSYLEEHADRTSRRLHFVGTSLALLLLVYALATRRWSVLILAPVVGYGFAWIGHYVFEKNRPATFRHPLYSLMGDCRMWLDMLRGRVPF